MIDERGPFIITASGRQFYLADPRAEDVHLPDILTAMDNTCRYTGHYRWSDAQHSLLCYFLSPCAETVAHDFPEAYYGDISRPLKAAIGDALKLVTKPIDRVVASALGLPGHFYHTAEVKKVDAQAFWVEWKILGMPAVEKFSGFDYYYNEESPSEIPLKAYEYAKFLTKFPGCRDRLEGICKAHFEREELW